MDFMWRLAELKNGSDTIVIFVDQFSKSLYFIPCKKGNCIVNQKHRGKLRSTRQRLKYKTYFLHYFIEKVEGVLARYC